MRPDGKRASEDESPLQIAGMFFASQNLEISDNGEAVRQKYKSEIRQFRRERSFPWNRILIVYGIGIGLLIGGGVALSTFYSDGPGRSYLFIIAAVAIPAGLVLTMFAAPVGMVV
jgi:hypothetical protein